MPDKDIDALFRSELEGFEAQPSAGVWENINSGLNNSKRRRSLLPVWSAAASVALLIAAGLYFMPRNKKADDTAARPRLALTRPRVNPPATPAATSAAGPLRQVAGIKPAEIHAAARKIETRRNNRLKPAVIDQPEVIHASEATTQQVSLAAVQTEKVQVNHPVVPDDMPLSIKINDNATNTVKPEIMASAIPDAAKAGRDAPKKHGIHTLGDFINTVVASVDKRKDKIIEFSDTDDGESSITGINLGIFKVKKNK